MVSSRATCGSMSGDGNGRGYSSRIDAFPIAGAKKKRRLTSLSMWR